MPEPYTKLTMRSSRRGPGEVRATTRDVTFSPMSPSPSAAPPSETSLGWSGERIAAFRTALLSFFAQNRRPLSWRENRDPYRVLVSEVMLQQTRVETVTPYFDRWMERFPDLQSLADAEEEEVLTLWAGLGYYSRARRLQATVREVLAQYDGELPESVEELERLPGIGAYTAGAIASIAFGSAVPAVDGNVRRVLSRISDVGNPSPGTLRRWAGELVDPNDPGGFNQGLMELGSLVCSPRNPRCNECPVSPFCAAFRAGTQHLRPTPAVRRPSPFLHEAVTVLVREDGAHPRTLLRKRPSKGLLGGMWEFPGMGFTPSEKSLDETLQLGYESAKRLAVQLLRNPVESAAIQIQGEGISLPPLDHIFSHKKVRYTPFVFRCRPDFPDEEGAPETASDRDAPRLPQNLRWVSQDESEALPLPAAQRTLAWRVWST